MELYQANREWSSRPADQRFVSLDALSDFQNRVRDNSQARVVSSRQIQLAPVQGDEINGLRVVGPQGGAGAVPSHWSFGQLCQLAGAGSGTQYLRSMPASIVAQALSYNFTYTRDIAEVGVLLTRGADNAVTLTSANGPNYGRVWDADVTDTIRRRVGNGVPGVNGNLWTIPGIRGKALSEVTKDNTTLYASDRDMFIFLADETRKVTVPNRRAGKLGTMSRGFFVWNSITGSKSLGAAFFLYDEVCENRIVWGATQYSEIRLRHTSGAPDRWLGEVTPVLESYAQSSAGTVEDAIKAAQAAKVEDAREWLAKRYTKTAAAQYVAAFERDEGRPVETLWDVATGMTAYARGIEHTDSRVAIEREAGKVLALAAPEHSATPIAA